MKDTILNILLMFLSKKTRVKLIRKLDLLESLSGKRCLGCQKFLHDISFDNSFCPTCTGHAPEWIKYDLERQKKEKYNKESEKKGGLVRISFEAGKKGYQILHPCTECRIWNKIFLSKMILKFSEHQFKIPKKLKFVTSLDPKFQLKIKRGIDKMIDK